jgi:hypothetical protein
VKFQLRFSDVFQISRKSCSHQQDTIHHAKDVVHAVQERPRLSDALWQLMLRAKFDCWQSIEKRVVLSIQFYAQPNDLFGVQLPALAVAERKKNEAATCTSKIH